MLQSAHIRTSRLPSGDSTELPLLAQTYRLKTANERVQAKKLEPTTPTQKQVLGSSLLQTTAANYGLQTMGAPSPNLATWPSLATPHLNHRHIPRLR